MEFNYGFEYLNVRYAWKEKKLYRLPFQRNLKTYGLKEIKPLIIGCTTVYNIQRNKITIKRLQKLTKKIKWSIETPTDKSCPF